MKIKDLRERIGYFRNKKNFSARELSLMIGKHQGYINKLESIDFNLSSEALLEIIDALEIKPEEFFAENYQTYKLDRDLYDFISNMPKDKKENLLNFLKQK